MYVPMDIFLVETGWIFDHHQIGSQRGGPEWYVFASWAPFLRFYINNYDRVTRKDRSFGIIIAFKPAFLCIGAMAKMETERNNSKKNLDAFSNLRLWTKYLSRIWQIYRERPIMRGPNWSHRSTTKISAPPRQHHQDQLPRPYHQGQDCFQILSETNDTSALLAGPSREGSVSEKNWPNDQPELYSTQLFFCEISK